MRVAIVTESFLPTVNGVSNSVARVTEELERRGHEVLIVAPGAGPTSFSVTPVVRTRALALPGYRSIPVGLPSSRALRAVAEFAPDLIHVGGPVALGAWGLAAAARLGVPSVAVYQTDFPRFTRHYRLGTLEDTAWRWLRHLHGRAQLTLAPSRAAANDLLANGVKDVRIWGRGVDLQRFDPAHRDDALRGVLAPRNEVVVGYVGRLAREKGVERLASLNAVPGIRLVVIGEGPERTRLARRLPNAVFTGFRGGDELSRLFASLDLFVHTGTAETFCQTIQESLASGVPAVVPAVGGPLDLIQQGVNGLRYGPGDREALRRAVHDLVADTERRRRLAAAARPSVADRSWGRLVDQLLGHYDEAITRWSGSAPAVRTSGRSQPAQAACRAAQLSQVQD